MAGVATHYDHSLFLKSDGSVWATGDNFFGQLGDDTKVPKLLPKLIIGGVAAIATGAYHSLFLLGSGALYVSGDNDNGQLLDRSLPGTLELRRVEPEGEVLDVHAGSETSFIEGPDGKLRAWGSNYHGQLGSTRAGGEVTFTNASTAGPQGVGVATALDQVGTAAAAVPARRYWRPADPIAFLAEAGPALLAAFRSRGSSALYRRPTAAVAAPM